jgi:hypothetical protein
MSLSIVDPAAIPDWDSLVLKAPDYSFFHTSAWARALVAPYRFKPLYLAALDGAQLKFLMPLMEVKSLLTGNRGVSLPFTDQCPVSLADPQLFAPALQRAIDLGRDRGWRYIEWRDPGHFEARVPASESYYVHDLDLNGDESGLFSRLSSNNRRNIHKAEREGVTVSIETSPGSVDEFYRLNLLTRKRHGLPPQPLVFFRSMLEHVISKDNGVVAKATHGGQVIAALVFFHFGRKAIYKYGASDLAFQHLRPNNLVMWSAVKWYRDRGFENLNLGRTETDNPGLLQFKRTWGAKERLVPYHLYDFKKRDFVPARPRHGARLAPIFSRTPIPLLRLMGRLLYRHVG